MKPPYRSIEQILSNYVDEPYSSQCLGFLKANQELFLNTPGSTHNHQAWPGGYLDHIQEIMNVSLILYLAFIKVRPWPFKLSDALVALFFHDIEKPWAFVLDALGVCRKSEFKSKDFCNRFKMKKIREYGLEITPEMENAIKYAEGELKDYDNRKRVMGPMAAFCHMCDVYSARVGYNHPLPNNDPWPEAKRNR